MDLSVSKAKWKLMTADPNDGAYGEGKESVAQGPDHMHSLPDLYSNRVRASTELRSVDDQG